MNILEKAVAWVSPRWAMSRAQARKALEITLSFDGAKTGRRTDGWITSGNSADAEAGPDIVKLRERARDLVRNNQLAANALRQWVTKVVGHGIIPQSKHKSDATNAKIDGLWSNWSKKASADGLPHFEAIQQQVERAVFESGECFVRIRNRRQEDGMDIPFQVQVLEADYLDLGRTGVFGSMPPGNYVIQGVEFNALGQRTAYYLFPQHPGSVTITARLNLMGLGSQRVPINDATGLPQVLHIYDADRPGQTRGITRFAPVMLKMRDLDDYEEAHLVGKKVAACFPVLVTQPDSEEAIGRTLNSTSDGQRIEAVQPGAIQYLRPGEEVQFGKPGGESAGYAEYKRAQCRDLAAGLGIPYELLTQDLSQVNYSSYRGSLLAFKDLIEAARWNRLIPQLCQPIWDRFVLYAQLAGFVKTGDNYSCEWSTPPFDLLDRFDEAKADALELDLGTSTWPQLIGKKGYDPQKQIGEVTAWKPRLEAAGLGKEPIGKQGTPAI